MKKLFLLLTISTFIFCGCSDDDKDNGPKTYVLNLPSYETHTLDLQSPNQKIPDRKTKCVIKTHINIKQNVIFGAKLKPV